MVPVTAVIFDMDGVLINSHPYNMAAIDAALSQHKLSLSSIPDPHGQAWTGGTIQGLIDAAEHHHNIRLDRDEFINIVDELQFRAMSQEKALLNPELLRFLNELRDNNIKIGLCSSSSNKRILRTLELLAIEDYFDAVVGANDVAHHKPAPHSYLLTAKLLAADPIRSFAIEDSVAGIESAKRAGMRVIAFSGHTKNPDKNNKADLSVESYNQLNLQLLSQRLTKNFGAVHV